MVLSQASPHDWDATSYDRIAQPQTRWGATVLGRLDLSGAEWVLDAGCGTGRVTEGILARLPQGRVVGLDGSPAMVAAAAQRLADQPCLSLLAADLRRPLPFASGCFDAVISTATFHWLPDHSALFGELSRVLRDGGQLVAQCGGPGNIAAVLEALRRVAPRQAHPTTYATAEETRSRLAQAGFTGVETWLNPEVASFSCRADLERFLATVILWPNLKTLPAQEHGPFVSQVADELPGWQLDYVRLNMQARKAGG